MSLWVKRPVLVTFSAELPLVGRHALAEAIKWWASKGVTYLELEEVPSYWMTAKPWPGRIQVLDQEPPDGSSGFTQLHHSALGAIDAAQIAVSCKWYRAQTFAHELGHALGLEHTTQRENLMFTETSPGRSGLTKKQLRVVI